MTADLSRIDVILKTHEQTLGTLKRHQEIYNRNLEEMERRITSLRYAITNWPTKDRPSAEDYQRHLAVRASLRRNYNEMFKLHRHNARTIEELEEDISRLRIYSKRKLPM